MLKNIILLSVLVSINTLPIDSNKNVHNCCPGSSSMTEQWFEGNVLSQNINLDFSQIDDDRVTYFSNLFTYSPVNSHGSCGYVSFIQYLSYYDCFYNDSIIPEQYERNQGDTTSFSNALSISPGVLRYPYPSGQEALYTHISNYKETDYQMLLMYIVNESRGNDSSDYSCSIGMWDYYRIIGTIPAFSNTGFSYTSVSNFGNNAKPTDQNVISWFDAYVKNQLDNGNPVMLHIAQYDSITGYNNYHSVVAYYYDSSGIYANFGWGVDSTCCLIPSSYQITEAGVIDFSLVSETHSHNFIVNGNHYCGCGLLTGHYYVHSYVYVSNYIHKAYCLCGIYITEPHSIDYSTVYFHNGHLCGLCSKCGVLIEISGNGPIIPVPG